MTPEPDIYEVVSALFDEIERLNELATHAITEAKDVDRALEAAKMAYARARKVAEIRGHTRNDAAGHVWHKHELSLAVLADRVGVSKSWAEEIVKRAKAKKEEGQC